MGVASDEDLLSQRLHQPEHGLDAESAASGAEKTAGCAVQLGVEPFSFGDGALGFKQTVGAPDFGEVPGGHCREEAQGRSFMPRRMEPGKILPAQPFDGVEQGVRVVCMVMPAFRVKFCAYHTTSGGSWQAACGGRFSGVPLGLGACGGMPPRHNHGSGCVHRGKAAPAGAGEVKRE